MKPVMTIYLENGLFKIQSFYSRSDGKDIGSVLGPYSEVDAVQAVTASLFPSGEGYHEAWQELKSQIDAMCAEARATGETT